MCGRARAGYRADQIRNIVRMERELHATHPAQSFSKVENFCPGRKNCVCVQQDGNIESRDLVMMTWGLIPRFAPKNQKLDHFFMMNCRVETIAEKRSFKSLLERGKRCVVVHNGFYEWTEEVTKEKRPFYIFDPQDRPMLFAALYDDFETNEGMHLQTYTILTQPACSKLKFLHHRQPIRLMTDAEVDAWVNPTSDLATEIMPLVNGWQQEAVSEGMAAHYDTHPVTPRINTLRYQGDDCAVQVKRATIKNFFKSPVKDKNSQQQSTPTAGTDGAASSSQNSELEDVRHDFGRDFDDGDR
jgi:putative SOS response-associated peptidase YedK